MVLSDNEKNYVETNITAKDIDLRGVKNYEKTR